MDKLSYRRHRFPSIVIQQAVWLYFRFALSYRDVEDMLAERGIDVSYETVRRWSLKFGGIIARRLRRGRPRPDGRWHLDEVFVSINGSRLYLWRAVDSEGEALDILVQRRRDKRAALKLMRKLLKNQGFVPDAFVTDKMPSYGAALSNLGLSKQHDFGGRKNNRAAEFASAGSATRATNAAVQIARISSTISVHPCRHLQHLQRPTPSDLPEDTPPVPRRGDGAMAASDSGGINRTIPTARARAAAINVTTPGRSRRRRREPQRIPCLERTAWIARAGVPRPASANGTGLREPGKPKPSQRRQKAAILSSTAFWTIQRRTFVRGEDRICLNN